MQFDVDGTLVDWHNTMAPAVRDAVRAAAHAGLHVVISTGRSVPGVMDAVDKVGMEHGLAVASNGAVTFSYSPVELLGTVHFPMVGELPYLLSLPGHGFLWFGLQPAEDA